MNAIQAVKFLEVLASVAFLVWFFYGPWRRFVVDLTRQNLFLVTHEAQPVSQQG